MKTLFSRPLTTLLLAIGTTLVAPLAHACTSVDAAALRIELEAFQAQQRPAVALECMKELSSKIQSISASLSPSDRDVAIYAIAQVGSNSIQNLGQQAFHNTAAAWWSAYLTGVNPPYDWSRLNFAIRKLIQHARFSDLANYSETLINAIAKTGDKLRPDVSLFLVENLYRCPEWNVLVSAKKADVCAQACKPLLINFLKALTAARQSENGKNPHKGRTLANDLIALEERLICRE